MRGTSILMCSLVAASMGACTHESSTAPGLALVAIRQSADPQTVPFKSDRYFFHSTGVVADPDCSAPGERRAQLAGDGTATHLGNYTVTLSFCARAGGVLTDGRGTFVAANGDQLNFVFDGRSVVIPPTSVQFTSFATFTGGTGRFENATGDAISTGIVDRSTGLGTGEWDGNISVASSPF